MLVAEASACRAFAYEGLLIVRPNGFPARLRLKQRREFLRVQRGGHKHHLRHFMVFVSRRAATPNEAPPPTRLGVTVTRKIGNAVARNRIKRLVRDVFRCNRASLPAGLDIVWVAKQQAATAGHAEVLADFEALVRRGELTSGPRGRGSNKRKRR